MKRVNSARRAWLLAQARGIPLCANHPSEHEAKFRAGQSLCWTCYLAWIDEDADQ